MTFENILIVCIGNICRSPMAAALVSHQYPQKNIDSAGISALVGYPADPTAIEVMAASNIDITSHIAKQISTDLIGKSDLILTMSKSQTKWIEERWSHCRGKTFRIGHWIGKDIADPYRHDKQTFENTRKDIIDSLEQWADKIS